MPTPEYLIDGVIPAEGLSVAWGAPSAYKTFLGLAWTLSVAAGVPWLGHEVKQSSVIYATTEGRAGLGSRYRAWLQAHGLAGVTDVRFLTDTVNLLDHGDTAALRTAIAGLDTPVALLAIDTLARSMPGGDENSARDIGQLIAAVEGLSRATLLIHHSGIEGDRERGSTALRGGATMMARAKRVGRGMTLSCSKMRDGAEWPDIHLELTQIGSSCVLTEASKADRSEELRSDVMSAVIDHGPVSLNALAKTVNRRKQDVGRALQALEEDGLIEKIGDGWQVVPDYAGTTRNHPSSQGVREVVPEGGYPEGDPPREPPTPRTGSREPEPAGTGHAQSNGRALSLLEADAVVDLIKQTFDATEIADEEFDGCADVQDWPRR